MIFKIGKRDSNCVILITSIYNIHISIHLNILYKIQIPLTHSLIHRYTSKTTKRANLKFCVMVFGTFGYLHFKEVVKQVHCDLRWKLKLFFIYQWFNGYSGKSGTSIYIALSLLWPRIKKTIT